MSLYKFFRHGQASSDGTGSWEWVLVDVDKDLPELRKKFKNKDIYLTVQGYNEAQVALVSGQSASVYELQGEKSNSPYVTPIYFDLDSQDPEVSRIDAKKTVDYLMNDLQVPECAIEIYFSGKKGFHIIIDNRWIDMDARNDWHHILKLMTRDIARSLDLTTWDHTVYSSRRMLRIANSQHASTNLFKVLLHKKELDLPIEDIMVLAKKPRELEPEIPSKSDELKLLSLVLDSYIRQSLAEKSMKDLSAPENLTEILQKNPVPACIVDLLERGIWKEGDRNLATLALASYFKCAGKSLEQGMSDVIRWSKMLNPKLTSTHGQRLTVNTRSVVETVYRDPKYVFKCPFILSLGDKANKIKCLGRMCFLHESNLHKTQDTLDIPLNEAYMGSMVGKKVKTHAMVSIAPGMPFIIAKKVRMSCTFTEDCKTRNCILCSSGQVERELDASDRDVLRLCHKTEGQEKGIYGSYLNAGGCRKFEYEVLEHQNVFDVTISTTIEYKSLSDLDKAALKDAGKEKYFTTTLYMIGERMPEFNKRYCIEGYILPHPVGNRSVILSDKVDSEATILDEFVLTPEKKAQFPAFRPSSMTPLAVKEKFNEIAEDIAEKSFQLHCRNEVMQAIILTYHSVLQFTFDGRTLPRGWMDLLIIGDSGEGKSFATRSFMDMVRLGEYASGESSKRTGLIYTITQVSDKWYVRFGKYVQMDRQALLIDEAAELDGSELGKMTSARSDGILRVDQSASAEAYCRTRVIFIANPRTKRHIDKFKFPIDAVNEVFDSPADVRRLDLAIILNKNDVPAKDMNARAKRHLVPTYTAEMMHTSVVWAWTRTADQIIFEPTAEEAILEYSIKLWDAYQHETIELIPKGDTREKLARMSVAMACLIKSTDETGECVVVTSAVVTVVYDYICMLYDSYGLRTASFFSQASNADAAVTRASGESRLDFAMRKGRMNYHLLYDILKKEINNDKDTINHLLQIICRMDNFRIRDLSTTLTLDAKKLGSLFRILMSAGFLLYSSGSYSDTYSATAKLQSALRYMLSEESIGPEISDDAPGRRPMETPIE